MRIALVGRGRLAFSLLPALQRAGHEVVSVNSRTLAELPQDADVCIISVKDSALQEVISQVACRTASPVFLHTAGSMPMTVFEGHARRYGVFYPMQTFSKERQVDFSFIPTFVEASDAATLDIVHTLAASISQRVYELSTEDRKYLHLAAVFACNFANHCYAMSAELLEKHGLPFDVMLPLIDETARKVHELHPRQAQTGPAVRYDENVIRMQSELLAEKPELQRIYLQLSDNIHQYAGQQALETNHSENHD